MIQKEKGFTIVELVLAMAFFSFILLFVVVGFVQINRSYTRGITVKEVQNSTRFILGTISDVIRNADANSITTINDPRRGRVCADGVRVAWNHFDSAGNYGTDTALNTPPGQDLYSVVLTTHDTGVCGDQIDATGGSSSIAGYENLTQQDIVAQHISVNRIGASNSYRVIIVMSSDARLTGNPDDFSSFGINATCEIQTGDQFCDVARIDTVVTARN